MAKHRRCFGGDVIHHRHRVAHIAVPRIELCVIAIAVAALIPADDTPTGSGEQWRKHVVGTRKIETAMNHEQRIGALVAPFVNGNLQLSGRDEVIAIGRMRTGVVAHRGVRGRV